MRDTDDRSSAPIRRPNDTAPSPHPLGERKQNHAAPGFVAAVAGVAGRFPLHARRRLGGALALVLFAMDGRRRADTVATMITVAEATGRTNGRRLAVQSWSRYGQMLAETLPVLARHALPLDDLVGDVSGWEHLAGAVSNGRGAVLVGLHQGSWEVGARLIASRHPLAAIVDPVGPMWIDAPVQAARRAWGIRTIPADNGARGALAALRRGEAVAVLVDRPTAPGPGAITVRFLGVPTSFPRGPVRLSRRTGAPLVPIASWREPDGRHAFAAGPPVHVVDHPTDKAALAEVLVHLEAAVRRDPAGWFMFRRVWPAPADPGLPTLAPGADSPVETITDCTREAKNVQEQTTVVAPELMLMGIARMVGGMLACLPSARRASMVSNVATLCGWRPDESRVASTVDRAMRLQAENYVDLYRTSRIGTAETGRRIQVCGDGWEQLREDVAAGGAVLVSAHVGRLELLGHALLRAGLRVVLVVEALVPAFVHSAVARLRTRAGLSVVTASDGARLLYRAVSERAVVACLIDWVPPEVRASSPGIRVVVGHGALDMPAMPFRLAARRKVPLHFGYGVALPRGDVRAVIGGRVAGSREAEVCWGHDVDADARAAAGVVGRRLGKVLTDDPSQWTIGHPVALARPNGPNP